MTASEPTRHAGINEVLRDEISATMHMIDTLQAERRSIIDADAETLEGAVREKELALERLQQLEVQRIALVKAAGFSPNPEGMMAYLESAIDRDGIAALWKQLLERTSSCRDQNRENFQLVEMYSQHTRQVLCILRGEDTVQDVYGPAGLSRDRHERRSLAKA